MSLFKKNISIKLEDIYTGHHKVTYKGVPAIKCPFDYTLYQMIIQEVQPDLVIEIGTNKGGSTLYIADLLELNKKGEDGSHQYKDTLATLNKFAPFVSKDSYFIVEDGIVNELGWEKEFNGGPQKALKEFLERNSSFIVDKKWCNFFGVNATFNVNGYLKKII